MWLLVWSVNCVVCACTHTHLGRVANWQEQKQLEKERVCVVVVVGRVEVGRDRERKPHARTHASMYAHVQAIRGYVEEAERINYAARMRKSCVVAAKVREEKRIAAHLSFNLFSFANVAQVGR